ncbi:hypothetical protein DESUT3_34890 [Desulfuromonas versatilis]|uniref:Glycogen synthase n=1 Tax=Desulfuromonas versatilis TaxID=2802975 RepID=A0ABM8HWU7_9BACT|nr:glycogen synthase GlgA [Desulfuromonas versatilis]BCR06420.1 hypothetical protein DESUT3_34890 [Desulfuromonas versatilis]
MTQANQHRRDYFPLALQISSRARETFELPAELLRERPPSRLRPLQQVAGSLTRRRPRQPASAAQLNLLALLNEIFRLVAGRFLEAHRCSVGRDAIRIDGQTLTLPALGRAQQVFVGLFPPAQVLHGQPQGEFLEGEQAAANRRDTLVELFILATQSANPAAQRYSELFDDAELSRAVAYRQALAELDSRLQLVPAAGLLGRSLLALLRAPIEAAPDSLAAQVAHIRDHWGELIPEELLRGLLVALDVLAEEETMRGFGPGPAQVPLFAGPDLHYAEPEAFSADTAWMPNVVLIAKTIYVWLDQLSKKYRRPLTRLDQIPVEELDQLARWGFNSLWLIGIWERSTASQKIKRIMGNPEAMSSAYSLYDYIVAADLGGEDALAVLEQRCLERGIRLASDVVPNHTGIFSRWLVEHPDWYIQLDQPPYINYRFTGPDLSYDSAVSLQIEDGYWNHSDAAVVFKYHDRRDGRTRYIYHGNDGTHMPWNDTAQLNYLLPEVREAMIRTIIRVARRFRVIRFDAAMTLAKKHYQRLWFPQPGGGAGVPSRAEHWLSREEFERVFPVEFWREVVDRVAAEVPDTLLIAEAFWLMEGYFVRTLGMHRVYNSAFMNMLKLEENAKYRSVIKNILEFQPAILQRFVNFMNNPDEATAVEQFGKLDKYFGVAVLLVTMPGLPMFGHGQVEGLKEKYGMEYRKAYWDEAPDEAFIRHHEAQIFPLMHRRRLFSGAENFQLYDFWSGGHVDENVFAYSNALGEERALVVFNNHYGDTGGWIHHSVQRNLPEPGEETRLVGTTLAQALGLSVQPDHYLRYRDHRQGLEYLLPCGELAEQGLHLQLGPYEYRGFLDFKQIHDADGLWGQLCRDLDGRGVPSLDWELRRIRYAPLIRAFQALMALDLLQQLPAALALSAAARKKEPAWLKFSEGLESFLLILTQLAPHTAPAGQQQQRILAEMTALAALAGRKGRRKEEQQALELLRAQLAGDGFPRRALPYLVAHRLAEPEPGIRSAQRSADWFEQFLLEHALQQALGGPAAGRDAHLVRVLIRHQHFWAPGGGQRNFARLLRDPQVRGFLQVNWADGIEWFNREALEELSEGLFTAAVIEARVQFADDAPGLLAHLVATHGELQRLQAHAVQAGYQLGAFLELVRSDLQERFPRPAVGKAAKKRKILLVSSEVTPFAKSGGLADVAGSLPQALRRLGHDVRIIMPFYQAVARRGETLEKRVASLEVEIAGAAHIANIHRGALGKVPVYFVENREYFEREGLYGTPAGDFDDNHRRFGFFCRAVLEALPLLDFRPEVIHLNDWQSGLVPALLRSEYGDDPFYSGTGTLLTIHNLGYQGMFGREILDELGLDPALGSMHALEYYGGLSFLKGGLMFSDLLNTVSKTYCREIQTPEMGIGFDGILRHRGADLHGIVNGIDPGFWNPAADPALPAPYDAEHLEGKAQCKRALQQQLGLAVDPSVPILAMVTRLDTQKGLEIVEQAWEGLMQRHLQFVLLGTGDQKHMERFTRLKDRYPGRVSINLSFDDALSRRIYAGSDLFLMPSLYEPCGLGQLIALRYGVVPVVRETGGLADTIIDPQQDPARANGFKFREPQAWALLGALDRALTLHAERQGWRQLVQHGMRGNFSWEGSAQRYLELYRKAIEKRNG